MLSMNELGVSLAIIRWPGDVRPIAPTVNTMAMAFSGFLFVVTVVGAPYLCAALHAPQATGPLRLLALAVLIDAATSVPAAFMTREFQQNRRLVVDTVGLVISSSVSIVLALDGHGVWSLAWGQIIGNIVNAALIIWWAPFGLRFGWRRDIVRELLTFGLPLAAASVMVFAMLNLDYIVVGSMLGPLSLGYYLLAFNLSGWPVGVLSAPIRRVSLAAFSRLVEEPARASVGFVRAFTLLLAITLPVCLGLAVLARPSIGFLYGEKWLPSAKVLPFLMVLALARVLAELAYDFLVALGRSRSNFLVQSLWFAGLVPALVIGAHLGGIVGVAIGHAICAALIVGPAYGRVLRRNGVSLLAILKQIVRPVVAAVLAGAAGWASLDLVDGWLVQILLGGTVIVLVYGAVVYPMRRLIFEGVAPVEPVAPVPAAG
jgi:O-antigen/teichoic acid export membrane protein